MLDKNRLAIYYGASRYQEVRIISSVFQTQASDEQEISALYDRMMESWNRGSGEGFAAPMTQDVDFVGFDGTWIRGRDAVSVSHEALFKTHLKGTRLVGEVASIRFLSPAVALMHARGNTIMRGKSKPSPARDSIQTLVAVKDGDTWSLAAFHNTRVRQMGRNFASILIWLVGDWLWGLALPRQRPTDLSPPQ